MKIQRKTMTAALLSLAFCVGTAQALAQRYRVCGDAPVLYSDDGFRGRSLTISQDVSDLHRLGMGDDASSVCVPFGWRVILYRDSDYRGSYLELRGPTEIADLKRDRPNGSDWGDEISSVRVYRPSRRGGRYTDCRVPTLFGDDDFDGRAVTVDRSIPDLHRLGVGDQASSICVPSGWVIIVYEDTNYRGQSLEIRGPDSVADLKRDRPGGSDWGDRISSVEAFRGGRRGRGQRGNGGYYEDRGDWGTPRASCDRYPLIYSDDDFRGRSLDLSTSIPDLRSRGMGDQVSSVCVPSGWRVILYEDAGYRGRSLTLDGPREVYNLDDDSWGDRASSVDVQAPGRWRDSGQVWGTTPNSGGVVFPGECDRYPMAFSDSGYRGRSLRLDNSVSDLHRVGFGDQISSVCVPYGWQLALYSDSNYRGDALRIHGAGGYEDLSRERPDGLDWGDRISSVRVTGGR